MDSQKQGTIYCGDNLEVIRNNIPDEFVDLIYIDPPFNSSRNYEVFWGEAQEKRAFEDRFGDAMHYLDWMWPRLRELHRVLKPTGSFYYHCDWHASHYIKVELDRIWGFENFQNEIIWHYRKWSTGKYTFQRNHDTLFLYSKTQTKDRPFNQLFMERTESTRKRFGEGKIHSGFDSSGRRVPSITEGKSSGVRLDDVWEIGRVPPIKQRYPTEKPVALLNRIVHVSSNPGDVVMDAFCGCGTSIESAARQNRQWIGIDSSPTACRVISERLQSGMGMKEGLDFELRDMPKSAEQLRKMPHFEFENWAVIALGGIPNRAKVNDFGVDGRLYLADISKERQGDFFETLDLWHPIQVKQIDKVGRPDIDKFQTAMRRDKRGRGYFVAFGFSSGAMQEIKRATQDGLDIVPVTVEEILRYERAVA